LSLTGATIYAFEPDPIAFKILNEKFGDKKNITCINKGVWDKNTTLRIYRHQEMLRETDFTVSSSIIAEKKNVDAKSAIEIEVINFIEFMRSLNRKIDLIKMDIEGGEIEILNKIISTDSQTLFKRMYVETHETKIHGQKEELEQIKKQFIEKGITNIKLNWI